VREAPSEAKSGKLTVHRGSKDGPVIATTVACEEKKGRFDIHFVDTKLPVIPLHHRHHDHEHHEHHFHFNNKWFHFGHHHHKEVDKDDKDTVAAFLPSILEGSYKEVVGKLHITLQEIQDLVVTTVLVAQEREEEKKPPVSFLF
jgi:hypothetical protein